MGHTQRYMNNKLETENMNKYDPSYLEPRVVKLEAGLDILTKNVTDLTTAVRENAISLDNKLERLTVAVTEAAAPKKTDWSTIIAAVMMIMAVGAAVLIPLNNTAQENRAEILRLHSTMVEHTKLDMHPVGLALVQRMEENQKMHITEDEKSLLEMRVHFHEEMDAELKTIRLVVEANQQKNDLHNDRVYGRVVKLEDQNRLDSEREKDELQMWRQRAMGLNNNTTPGVHSHLDIQNPTSLPK